MRTNSDNKIAKQTRQVDSCTIEAAEIELEAIFCSYKLLRIDVTYIEESRRRKSDTEC